jgi:hypothetical protein
MVLSALKSGIRKGHLTILDQEGTEYTFGELKAISARTAHLTVLDDAFWTRVYMRYDVGCQRAIVLQILIAFC